MRRTIIRNVFSNWAGLMVNMAITFFMSPFLVHRLGDNQYGLWVLIMSLTGYMGLVDAGLKVSIVKYVSRLHAVSDADGLNRTVSTALAMYGGVALLVVIATIGIEFAFPRLFSVAGDALPTARIVLLLAGANLALTLFLSVFNGFLAGLQRYDLGNKIGILVILFRSAAIFMFVYLGFGIVALGIIHLLAQVVTGVMLFAISIRVYPQLKIGRRFVSVESVKTLYSYSAFILLNNLAMLFLFKSGEIVAGMFISTAAVTYYAIAGGLTQYLAKIIGTMTQVLHPYASAQEARGDFASIRSSVIVGTKICLLIALPISAAFVLLGDKFIASWMGASYAAVSAPLLTVLTVSRMFWLAQSATGNILLGIGRHKWLTSINLATGIGSIIGSVVLVGKSGLYGMVLGSAAPVIVTQAIVMPLYTCRALGIGIRQYFRNAWLGPLIATIPLVILLLGLKQTALPDTLIGFGVSVLISLPAFLVVAFFICFSSTERQSYLRVLRSLTPLHSAEGQ